MRLLFDKPIRKSTTEQYFPNKITLNEFVTYLGLQENHGFTANMMRLQIQPRYIEEWATIFLSWNDIEQETDCMPEEELRNKETLKKMKEKFQLFRRKHDYAKKNITINITMSTN